MKIIKLDHLYANEIKSMFDNDSHFENFVNTYLFDLENFHAIGRLNNNDKLTDVISFYESTDEASYYITNILHVTDKVNTAGIFDSIINYNEKQGRLKFYSLVDFTQIDCWNEIHLSKKINKDYGYFDEFEIPARHQCIYTLPWQILFSRTLFTNDTVLRCHYLKQEKRKIIPIGGRL